MHFNPIYNHSLNKILFNFYRLFSVCLLSCLVCCVSFCICALVSICCFCVLSLCVIAILEWDNGSVIFLVDEVFDLVRF